MFVLGTATTLIALNFFVEISVRRNSFFSKKLRAISNLNLAFVT